MISTNSLSTTTGQKRQIPNIEARTHQRNMTIIELEFPEFIQCPSGTCQQVTKDNYAKHINTCKQIRSMGIQKLYQCQFSKYHVFKNYEDRDKHEKDCVLYQYNKYLKYQSYLPFFRGNETFMVVSGAEEKPKQQMPYHLFKKWEAKKVLELKLKEEQEAKEKLYQKELKQALIKHKETQIADKELQFRLFIKTWLFMYILRCDPAIKKLDKNNQEIKKMRCDIYIEDIIDIDENDFIIEILKDIKKQQDFDKVCVAQFLQINDFQDKNEDLKNFFKGKIDDEGVYPDPMRVGINTQHYKRDLDQGQILILVHRETLRVHKFMKSDWALLIIEKGNIGDNPYFINQEIQEYQKKISSEEYEEKLKEEKLKEENREKLKKIEDEYLQKKKKLETELNIMRSEVNEETRLQNDKMEKFQKDKSELEKDLNAIDLKKQELKNQIQKQKNTMKGMEMEMRNTYDAAEIECQKILEKLTLDYKVKMSEIVDDFYKDPENSKVLNEFQDLKMRVEKIDKKNAQKKREIQKREKDVDYLTGQIEKMAISIAKEEQEIQQMKAYQESPQVQEERDQLYCKMCRRKPAKIIFRPCGHLVYCSDCYGLCVQTNVDLRFCHLCGAIATSRINIVNNFV